MITTPIKDFYGKTIAFVYEDSNGNKTLKDFYGKVVGKYDKHANVTKDFYGRIVAHGDALMILLK